MKTTLEEAVALMVRSLEEAIQMEVSMRVRSEVERTLSERLSLLASAPVASKSGPGATIPSQVTQQKGDSPSGRQRGYLTYEDAASDPEPLSAEEMQERMQAGDWGQAIQSVASGRKRDSQPEMVAVPPKVRRGPGRPPKEKATASPIPMGKIVRFSVGRASDVTGEVQAWNSKNGKIEIAYVNRKGEHMTTERDPSLVEVV